MKPTTPYQTSSLPSATTLNQPIEDQSAASNASGETRAQVKSKTPKRQKLTPAGMEALLFSSLASEAEQRDSKISTKLQHPAPRQAMLPPELTTRIAWHVRSPRDQGNLALTCRQNYQSIDTAHPLRRFPGLARDLHRTSMKRELATAHQIRRYLQQLASGGSYDCVLLTPLSLEARIAALMAALSWANQYTLKKDKVKASSEALDQLGVATKLLKEIDAKKNNVNDDELLTTLQGIIYAVHGLVLTQGETHQRILYMPATGLDALLPLLSAESQQAICMNFVESYPLGRHLYDEWMNDLISRVARWPVADLKHAFLLGMVMRYEGRSRGQLVASIESGIKSLGSTEFKAALLALPDRALQAVETQLRTQRFIEPKQVRKAFFHTFVWLTTLFLSAPAMAEVKADTDWIEFANKAALLIPHTPDELVTTEVDALCMSVYARGGALAKSVWDALRAELDFYPDRQSAKEISESLASFFGA